MYLGTPYSTLRKRWFTRTVHGASPVFGDAKPALVSLGLGRTPYHVLGQGNGWSVNLNHMHVSALREVVIHLQASSVQGKDLTRVKSLLELYPKAEVDG